MTADAGGRSADLRDALYYGHLHGGSRLRRIFSGDGLLQRWLDAEAALAHAQARVGLIPEEAARTIVRERVRRHLDEEELERLLDPANHLGHSAAMVDGVLSAG